MDARTFIWILDPEYFVLKYKCSRKWMGSEGQ